MKSLLFTLLGFAALGTLGCSADMASPEETEGSTSQPILGGTTDTGDPSVVAIIVDGSSLCTGSIISSTKVLTARHCVEGASSWEVRTGTSANSPTSTLAVRSGRYSADGDIGVLTLSRATTLSPLPYNTTALSSADEGDAIRAVGYGSNKTNSGQGTGGGTKRFGDSTIGALQDDTFSAFKILCHGDSGGPVFKDGVIIGITSYGDPANCTGQGYAVRTDLYANFLGN